MRQTERGTHEPDFFEVACCSDIITKSPGIAEFPEVCNGLIEIPAARCQV